MYIPRDFTRTESDDFELRVVPRLSSTKEAVPVYNPALKGRQVVGWKIQSRYE